MANTGLFGPHLLNAATIDREVSGISPGTYVLGYIGEGGMFTVEYVGRSDTNLNERLHAWINRGYYRFKFGYFNTAKAAFEKECSIFHDFGEETNLDNEVHPDRPNGTSWQCPACGIYASAW